MNLLTGRNTPNFAKDTVYRFMKMTPVNWIRFSTILPSRIINETIDSEKLTNVLIIDESMFERNRSKKVEQAKNADFSAKVVYVSNRNKRKEYDVVFEEIFPHGFSGK